ncbi:uncharacterized protein LOC130893862 [Diorhabda carinulata]|uniref:uncharacterized protein LOC130893862 n=1 Tax=Diorhabda carinulata TaxID=1163345 RepID=UPI0025A2BF7D|nr:uncharacterized protein LOC130893862 [Diorhabda carinulata]
MQWQGKKSIDSSANKKRRRSELSSFSDNAFIDVEIRDFCPKRIFDIILINGSDAESAERLNKIITTAKNYEEVAFVTFIRYDEVLDVLNQFDYDVISDNFIKSHISNLIDDIGKSFKYLAPENYPPMRLALLMKIKIIEIMSRHRKRELEKIEKRQILFQALDSLTKECRKGKKDSRTHTDKNKDKTFVKDTTKGYIDTESEVIFDDDIFNHVWFYVFEGFFNVKVLNQFVNLTRVSLTAAIKFTTETHTIEYSHLHRKFWNDLDDYLYGHNRLENLENTILMTFNADNRSDIEVFESLWHVIKSISNIKIQHLNYIRHLKIYEMENKYEYLPLSCCTTYNKIMSNIPLQLSNEITILSSILEETCFRLDKGDINDRYSLKENISKVTLPFSKVVCTDPCNVSQTVTKSEEDDPSLEKTTTSYQCYDGDYLNMTINMYKPIGKVVNDLSLNVLKRLRPVYLLDYDYPLSELIHKHDVAPSVSKSLDKSEYLEDFLKLLIIASFRKAPEETTAEPVDFVSNLITYDVAAFTKMLQVMPFDGDSSTKFPIDKTYRPSPMDYYWKETYPSQVILQELLRVQNDFSCMDAVYCSDIERLLLSFHDDLDDFGINTQVFYESICTPVCLRDFCRYLAVSAADWLNENKPPTYVRKIEESEECPGTKKIRKLDIFPEYRHLLETAVVTEDDTSLKSTEEPVSSKLESTTENHEVTFDEMISELENYPSNKNLIFECYKSEFSKDFLAYNFASTKYFAIKGARTTFASHDNVKLIVNNTKMIEENNKCTVNLKYMNNNLFLHSHEMFRDSYSFHWLLEDGTIIMFEIIKTKKKSVKIPETFSSTMIEDDILDEPQHKEEEIDVGEKTVKTIDEKHMKDLFPDSKSENKEIKAEDDLVDETFDIIPKDIFQGLNDAIRKKLPIYKIHKDYEAIMLKNPVGQIPLVNIIQRILSNSRKIVCQGEFSDNGSSRKFIPTNNILPPLTVLDEISFRITLPNGIYLTCYPSQIRENLVEIKQEQLSTDVKSLRIEEFRLFTREGYILIKKIDGSIRLLMSDGNQIDFEKPDTNNKDIQNSPLKQFHCKNFSDYKKKLNKIMKNKKLEGNYYMSRRGSLKTKKGYVINRDIVKVLESSKLPYLKTTLLTFEGNRTVLAKNKLTQKKLYYTVSENDLVKEEISFERKDGLKCVCEKNGNRIVEFSDGTRISTSVRTSPELVDGYVYVDLYYKYEHPYYATVIYEVDELMRIVLNNDVVLEKTTNKIITLTMDNIVTTAVSADEVRFVKPCAKCRQQYICLFNIAPFHTNSIDFSEQFLHAIDSYGKHFFVDYAGNCKNNASYKNGPLNLENCNHQIQNTYKRLFALKKSFYGEEFHTNGMVNNLKEERKKKENTNIIERKVKRQQNEHLLLEFNTEHFESFADRYMSQAVVRSEVTLSKYKQINMRPLYYSTNKFIIKTLTTNLITKLLKTLMIHLSPDYENFRLRSLLLEFVNEKELEAISKRKAAMERNRKLLMEADKNCRCLKVKSTFMVKIRRWQEECAKFRQLIRERSIPLYFQSEFCHLVNE